MLGAVFIMEEAKIKNKFKRELLEKWAGELKMELKDSLITPYEDWLMEQLWQRDSRDYKLDILAKEIGDEG